MRPQTEMLLEKTRKFFSTVKHIYSRWEIERWIETKGVLAWSETGEGRERVGEKQAGCWRHTQTLLEQTSFGKHKREDRYAYKRRNRSGWRTLTLITGASLQIISRTVEQDRFLLSDKFFPSVLSFPVEKSYWFIAGHTLLDQWFQLYFNSNDFSSHSKITG